jgi:hypothetical protein
MSAESFREVVRHATHVAGGDFEVDGFGNDAKAGSYALVSPSGRLYGTEYKDGQLRHRFVGNMLKDHLDDLASLLPFDSARHFARYGRT